MLAPKNNTNWISVEDRMPQEGKDVLVFISDLDKIIVANHYQSCWSDTIPTMISNYWKVSHWQERYLCMRSGTCATLEFDHKTFCAITYTRCYPQYGLLNLKHK